MIFFQKLKQKIKDFFWTKYTYAQVTIMITSRLNKIVLKKNILTYYKIYV